MTTYSTKGHRHKDALGRWTTTVQDTVNVPDPVIPPPPDLTPYATKTYVDQAIAAALVPPVVPPTNEKIVQVSTLAALNGEMQANVDRIQVLTGDKLWTSGDQPIPFAWTDRTAQPLIVEFLAGAVLKGSGITLADGVISPTAAAKAIAFEGAVFDGHVLSSCGILSIRYGSYLRFSKAVWRNTQRDPKYAAGPQFSHCMYLWGSPDHIIVEDGLVEGSGRSVHSGFQIDDEAHNTTAKPVSIILRRMIINHVCFGWYDNLPATGVVLEDIAMTDVGGRGFVVESKLATGTYHNVTKDATSTDPFIWGKLVSV